MYLTDLHLVACI